MSVSVQCEHLHTILYNPFLSVSVLVSMSGKVNTPLTRMHSSRMLNARFSCHLRGGGVCLEGCLPRGGGVRLGVSVQGGCLPRGVYTTRLCEQNNRQV